MRRARIKVTPNVGGINRAAKPTPAASSVVPSQTEAASIPELKPENSVPAQPTVPENIDTPAECVKDTFPANVVRSEEVSQSSEKPVENPFISVINPADKSNAELSSIRSTPVELPKEEMSHDNLSSQDQDSSSLVPVPKSGNSSGKKSSEPVENESHGSAPVPRYLKSRLNKIRPVIKNSAHRVRTFSSASESEDEGKRQARKPLIPVKKSLPERENEAASMKPGEFQGKRKTDEKSQLEIRKENMRKKFAKGQVELSKMTMFDLIYYNPDGEKP